MIKTYYDSPLGPIILIANRGHLVYCNWDLPECFSKLKSVESNLDNQISLLDSIIINETARQLDQYFSGDRKEFDIPLSFIGTEFRRQIWAHLLQIKYGEVVAYRELAEIAGNPKGFRAVAGACGHNPISIIVPCHRVVNLDGTIGGYTGGIEKKISLLNLERRFKINKITKNDKIFTIGFGGMKKTP